LRGSKKGNNGRVLVVAGSQEYPGAAALCAIAALRCGVDLVRVAAPGKVAWVINSLCPDIITVKLEGEHISENHCGEISKWQEWADVTVIGNGLATDPSTVQAVRKICRSEKYKVIDADAIKAIDIKLIDNSIITPHSVEYSTMLDNAGIRDIQKIIGSNVIILKGPEDQIITSEKTFVNKTGTNTMTVGGTGDILAGLCAGFLASGFNKLESARYAAYINGKIGEKLTVKLGPGVIASDFLREIAVESKNLYKKFSPE